MQELEPGRMTLSMASMIVHMTLQPSPALAHTPVMFSNAGKAHRSARAAAAQGWRTSMSSAQRPQRRFVESQ